MTGVFQGIPWFGDSGILDSRALRPNDKKGSEEQQRNALSFTFVDNLLNNVDLQNALQSAKT